VSDAECQAQPDLLATRYSFFLSLSFFRVFRVFRGPITVVRPRRCDDEFILSFRRRWQFVVFNAPAVVSQGAAERRIAVDVSGQANRGAVEAGGYFDAVALLLRHDRSSTTCSLMTS